MQSADNKDFEAHSSPSSLISGTIPERTATSDTLDFTLRQEKTDVVTSEKYVLLSNSNALTNETPVNIFGLELGNIPTAVDTEVTGKSTESKVAVNNSLYDDNTAQYFETMKNVVEVELDGFSSPRLVLLGDRGSGKSSLLENLVDPPLPIPLASAQNTNFAIEINMINDPSEYQIQPKIILDEKFLSELSKKGVTAVDSFNSKIAFTKPIGKTEFENVLREVSSILGVKSPIFEDRPAGKPSSAIIETKFSHHCLKFVVKGPKLVDISIVDTPCLDKSDQAADCSLGRQFLNDKNSAILVVIDATKEKHVFDALGLVKSNIDPFKERTLRAYTRCDCISRDNIDGVKKLMQRLKSEDPFPVYDPYFIANNIKADTEQDASLEEGQSREANLFAHEPWNLASSGVVNGQKGIDALRSGFRKLFRNQVRTQIPHIKQRAKKRLEEMQLTYDASRKHIVETQRKLLLSVVRKYQISVKYCLAESFSELKKSDSRRLPIRLENCKEIHLCQKLVSSGERRDFDVVTYATDEESDRAASTRCSSDLDKETNIYTWINERYQSTKTSSIPGLIPSLLLEKLFKEQVAPWSVCTDEFAAQVMRILKDAVKTCLRLGCNEDWLRPAMERLTMELLQSKMDRFKELCAKEHARLTTNTKVVVGEAQFLNEIRQARVMRLKSMLNRIQDETKQRYGLETLAGSNSKCLECVNEDRQVIYQIHDILKAYYNLALPRYLHRICNELMGNEFLEDMMGSCSVDLFDALSDKQIVELFKDSPADAETNLSKTEAAFQERSTKLKQVIGQLENLTREFDN